MSRTKRARSSDGEEDITFEHASKVSKPTPSKKRGREDDDALVREMESMHIQKPKRTMSDITRPSLPGLREKRIAYYEKQLARPKPSTPPPHHAGGNQRKYRRTQRRRRTSRRSRR